MKAPITRSRRPLCETTISWQCGPLLLLVATLFVSTQALAGSDQDGDGVADLDDNCLLAANPSQLDSNGDGYGNACDPDLNNDGTVNFIDLQMMRLAFFANPASPNWNPDADLNGDSFINFPDLLIMHRLSFRPPGPVGLVYWVEPAFGNWNDETKWFPNAPIAENAVLIGFPGIGVLHDSGDNVCASLVSEADIILSGGSSLTVHGTLDMRGNLTVTGTDTRLRDATIVRTGEQGTDPLTVAGDVIFDNVVLGVDLTIPNDTTVYFENGLTLDNTVLTLKGNAEYAQAVFDGTQTLGGTGEILLDAASTVGFWNRLFARNSGDVLTVGSGITVRSVRGGGWLGTDTAGHELIVLGDIIVDGSDEVTVQGDPLTIDADLSATSNGTIRIDGNWTASSTTTMTATDSADLELFGNWSSEATIIVDGGELDIGSNNNSDSWINLGTITVIDSATTQLGGVFVPGDMGNLTIDGNTLLNGRLILTGLVFDLDAAPGLWKLGLSGIIQDGTVTGTLLDIVGNGDLDGTTLAVDTIVRNGVSLDVFNGLTLDNVRLTMMPDSSFTIIQFVGTQTLGGTGELLLGGTFATGNTNNRIFSAFTGDVLTIGPGITVRTLSHGGLLGTNAPSRGLNLLGPVIVDEPGAILTIQGDLLTIDGPITGSQGAGITIDGVWSATSATTITMSDGGELELFGEWVNNGTITVTDGLLDIGNTQTESWANLGSIALIDSDASLAGFFMQSDLGSFTSNGAISIGGVLDNTGQTLDLDTAPGTWELGSGGTIIGGTIAGTSFTINGAGDLDGVTLSVNTTLGNSSTGTVTNGLTLDNASLTLASDGDPSILSFSGSQTLGGTGEVLFGGTTTSDSLNRIEPAASGDTLTIGENITIRPLTTGGIVGSSGGGHATTLQGSLVSDMAGDVITINGDPFTNNGSVIIDAGSVIAGTTDYVQGASGRLEVEVSGTLLDDFGHLTLTGGGSSTTLSGTLDIVLTGFAPSLGNTFEIIGAGVRSGEFSSVTGTDAGSGLTFVPIYNSDNVTLDVQ